MAKEQLERKDLLKGKAYVSLNPNPGYAFIMGNLDVNSQGAHPYLLTTSSIFTTGSVYTSNSNFVLYREATEKEETHLQECILQNRYVKLEELPSPVKVGDRVEQARLVEGQAYSMQTNSYHYLVLCNDTPASRKWSYDNIELKAGTFYRLGGFSGNYTWIKASDLHTRWIRECSRKGTLVPLADIMALLDAERIAALPPEPIINNHYQII